MSETPAAPVENDLLRETLIDFAEWRGDIPEDAEWAAETYLRESDQHLLSPATRRSISPSAESTHDGATSSQPPSAEKDAIRGALEAGLPYCPKCSHGAHLPGACRCVNLAHGRCVCPDPGFENGLPSDHTRDLPAAEGTNDD